MGRLCSQQTSSVSLVSCLFQQFILDLLNAWSVPVSLTKSGRPTGVDDCERTDKAMRANSMDLSGMIEMLDDRMHACSSVVPAADARKAV